MLQLRSGSMVARFARRRFLLTGGSLGLLAACGSSAAAVAPEIVGLYSSDRVIAAGRRQRIPFAVVSLDDLTVADVDHVPVRVLFDGDVIEQTTVAGRVVDHDHVGTDVDPEHQHSDLLRYYALRTELPEPGIYDLEIDFGEDRVGRLTVQAFDADETGVVQPGEPMPALATATVDDPAGVDPLCTRLDPCLFHGLSVERALAERRPFALLVATPALCATAYCGPVLETLIEAAPDYPNVAPIHLEVYRNAAEVGGNYEDTELEVAAPVLELGLDFEPSLFLVDQAGIVVDRIDNVFDESELRAGLTAIDQL